MKFEVTRDRAGKGRWSLRASNGESVASSGESFATISNARRAAANFKARSSSARYDIYEDASGEYRWRAVSPNGQTIASSGETFASRAGAQRAADNVRDKAGAAEGP